MFQVNSQNTLKKGEVKPIINNNGDTLIILRVDDALLLLKDLTDYTYTLDLIKKYEEYKSSCDTITKLQAKQILLLTDKNKNNELIIANLNKVIYNKDEELKIKDGIIKKQKKEIRKQKILKYVGFTGAIVLPVITALFLLK